MKKIYFLVLAVTVFSATSFGQAWKSLSRLDVDTSLAPFYHGVASGDPLTDRVIIWTRVTTQQSGTVAVKWWVATDTTFSTIVRQDSTTTDSTVDYTVKVDVTGLQPGTWYYYRFQALGRYSITGRMKTVPNAGIDHLRVAVVSCNEYQNGYFNAFASIAKRNDIDAVIHLGDYIYEYGSDSVNHPDRLVDPPYEMITLQDYRARYAHYRLDSQLRAVQQQYCFINIWDDHEFANDAWVGGAQNHTDSTEGPWSVREANAKEAFFNWVPIRHHAAPNSDQIYRNKFYGDLVQFIYLDTRVEGRQLQTRNASTINDTARTIISETQLEWLEDRLKDNTAQWKIIAQQIMVAPLVVSGYILNPDQWDDYPADRAKLYNTILDNNVNDVAVLTGDIHSAWGNDLRTNGDTGDSVCVEFVGTSITSQGFQGLSLFDPDTIRHVLPHVKYVNLNYHGYFVLDITRSKTQADYYVVDRIDTPVATTSLDASWYEQDGERFLRSGTEAAPYATPLPPLAPVRVQDIAASINGPAGQQEIIILGAYPNPTDGAMLLQYFLASEGNASAMVFDMSGKLVYNKPLAGQKGVNYTNIYLDKIEAGNYLLVLSDGVNTYHKLISKAK